MKRFVSVWFPMWPIDRMRQAERRSGKRRLRDDKPFALVDSGVRGLVITAANQVARADGVRPGQVLADARAALPSLMTASAECEKDRVALRRLAYWCGRYGPARNVEGVDGIWIETTGVDHLFGGEDRMLDDLVCRFGRFGLTVRAAVGDTHGSAFALARFGCDGGRSTAVAPPEGGAQALAGLPVEALRLEDQSVLLLKRLGLRQIGQLFALPREALARRFREMPRGNSGRRRVDQAHALRAAGEVVLRLDQALGGRVEMKCPLLMPPVHCVRQSYADPLISAEGVEAHAGQLADALCDALDATGEGARRLRFSLYRADGTSTDIVFGTSRPVRQPEHFMDLLREKLGTVDAGFGVDMMTLEALEVGKLDAQQRDFSTSDSVVRDGIPPHLIDTLANRLGASSVRRLAAFPSHIPERAWRQVAALDGGRQLGTAEEGGRQAAELLRPPFLLARPERIEVLAAVPDGPPMRFTWRRVARRVVRAEGPERIAPEWWRGIGVASRPGLSLTRDYYRIEDDAGARYWVFRAGLYCDDDEEMAEACGDEERPRWFMHGFLT